MRLSQLAICPPKASLFVIEGVTDGSAAGSQPFHKRKSRGCRACLCARVCVCGLVVVVALFGLRGWCLFRHNYSDFYRPQTFRVCFPLDAITFLVTVCGTVFSADSVRDQTLAFLGQASRCIIVCYHTHCFCSCPFLFQQPTRSLSPSADLAPFLRCSMDSRSAVMTATFIRKDYTMTPQHP